MRRKAFWILLGFCLLLSGCGGQPGAEIQVSAAPSLPAASPEPALVTETPAPAPEESSPNTEEENKPMLQLWIDDTEVSAEWEENPSVEALMALCRTEPLTLSLSRYGGFEQVGPIGSSLPRDDVQTSTQPGDIVLYAGNQIVVFYGSNSWAYTRLGHITDRSAADLAELLGQHDVRLTLRAAS